MSNENESLTLNSALKNFNIPLIVFSNETQFHDYVESEYKQGNEQLIKFYERICWVRTLSNEIVFFPLTARKIIKMQNEIDSGSNTITKLMHELDDKHKKDDEEAMLDFANKAVGGNNDNVKVKDSDEVKEAL